MKRTFMFIYCSISLVSIALTVYGNSLLNEKNNVLLNFLFFLPILLGSLLTMFFVNKKTINANTYDIVVPFFLSLATGIPMVIIPMFATGLANNSLYLSNVVAYFVTYIYSSGIALSKTTQSKRASLIIVIFSNAIYWWSIVGSIVNCFYKFINYNGPIIV